MFNIGSFFEKFKDYKNPSEEKELAAKVIFEVTGILLTKEEVSFQGKNLFLKTSQLKKQEICMRKEIVLHQLATVFPQRLITDLR